MVRKHVFNGMPCILEFNVRYGLYDNCTYDDPEYMLREIIKYMKEGNEDTELNINVRWL